MPRTQAINANDGLIEQPILSPKDRLGWLASRGHVTEAQRVAGDVLMKHRERSKRVAYASSGGGHANGNLSPLEAQQTAKRRYERAMQAVTPLGEAVITAIVIENLSVEEAALQLKLHPKAITPLLRLALEVLAQHYHVTA